MRFEKKVILRNQVQNMRKNCLKVHGRLCHGERCFHRDSD